MPADLGWVDTRYHNQAYVTRGVAIFTDPLRALIRRELEARDGGAWWDRGVWPWLSEAQRNTIIESRANDAGRAEPGDGLHAAASLNGPGTDDNNSRQRLLLLLDAFGLVFLVALLALFAVPGIRGRPGDAGP